MDGVAEVLQPADYLQACEAHMKGRNVSVKGLLERRGKYTRLTNATDFRPGQQMNLLDELEP